jgi:hypothetical protein
VKVGGVSEIRYIEVGSRENNIFGSEGSQAILASPPGKGKAYD